MTDLRQARQGWAKIEDLETQLLRRHGVAFFQDPTGTRIDVMLAETSFDETVIGRARRFMSSCRPLQTGWALNGATRERLLPRHHNGG